MTMLLKHPKKEWRRQCNYCLRIIDTTRSLSLEVAKVHICRRCSKKVLTYLHKNNPGFIKAVAKQDSE
jgi:rRNA maturation endonuclease Nob1